MKSEEQQVHSKMMNDQSMSNSNESEMRAIRWFINAGILVLVLLILCIKVNVWQILLIYFNQTILKIAIDNLELFFESKGI